jgi:hypothetical protein
MEADAHRKPPKGSRTSNGRLLNTFAAETECQVRRSGSRWACSRYIDSGG